MRNQKQFSAAVIKARESGEKVSDLIHELAVDSLEFMLVHGQDAYIRELVSNLPKGIKAQAVKAWLVKYGPFSANEELAYSKAKRKAIVEAGIQVTLDEAKANAFWTIESEKKVSAIVLDFDKALNQFLAAMSSKAAKAKESGQDTVDFELKLEFLKEKLLADQAEE